MSPDEEQAVRAALSYVSSVDDITFTEVDSGGNIQFGTNNQNRASSGYAYYPNTTGRDQASVYIANDIYDPSTTDWSPGTNRWFTLIHEIGHALGLKHPGNYAGGGSSSGPYLPKALDNTANPVMSYNSPKNAVIAMTTPNGPGKYLLFLKAVVPNSYQALDIKALHYMYGKSQVDAETAAQTYRFGPRRNSDNQFMETISNTNAGSLIDASDEVLKSVIDLRAGHTSSIGIRSPYDGLPSCYGDAKTYARNVPGGPKPTYDGRNNLTIASGSLIDAAMAGQAGDTIIGNNDATNAIVGGNGDDAIFLGKANSRVAGGGITETLSGVEKIQTWNGTALKGSGKNLAVLA
jgi:serralysin